jgi:hypothetical protein
MAGKQYRMLARMGQRPGTEDRPDFFHRLLPRPGALPQAMFCWPFRPSERVAEHLGRLSDRNSQDETA